MTDQEFWKRLKDSFQTKEKQAQIPFLIQQAEKENLNLPVVTAREKNKTVRQTIHLGSMKLLQCATTMPAAPGVYADPLKPGQTVSTVPLKGLFAKLKKDGYDGIVFLHNGGLTGFDWKDFTSHPNKPLII